MAVAKERGYDKPWLTNTKRTKKTVSMESTKPEWDKHTKMESTTFDDLWREGTIATTTKGQRSRSQRSPSPMRKTATWSDGYMDVSSAQLVVHFQILTFDLSLTITLTFNLRHWHRFHTLTPSSVFSQPKVWLSTLTLQDEDLLYRSYGYRGPHRAQNADPLAGEFSIAKPDKKSQSPATSGASK